jgi:hypothetical protein
MLCSEFLELLDRKIENIANRRLFIFKRELRVYLFVTLLKDSKDLN